MNLINHNYVLLDKSNCKILFAQLYNHVLNKINVSLSTCIMYCLIKSSCII
jgi:hypothetical protein